MPYREIEKTSEHAILRDFKDMNIPYRDILKTREYAKRVILRLGNCNTEIFSCFFMFGLVLWHINHWMLLKPYPFNTERRFYF